MKIALYLLALLSTPLLAASPEAIYGKTGIVTSRSALASAAGLEIMKAGGNAVDGAVATAFTLAVTYPSAGNLGGGGFAVVRLADGKVVTLDHRETAPASASRDMYLDSEGNIIKKLSTASHKATGTPGSVDGLITLLETYGSLSIKQVIAPAIRLAEKGFPLSHDLARQFNKVLKKMEQYPESIKTFSKKGAPYEEGDIWRQPELAKTLERIADSGRDGFYKGKTADLIVAEMQRGNGEITLNDLANYKSIWRKPVKGTYRGYDIYGMGPPSSGGALVIQILNMMETYDVSAMGFGSAKVIHLMVEAERRAYADRAEHLGDPDYYDVPIAKLTNKSYAAQRFSDFNSDKASKSENIGAGYWPEESPETTHLSVYKEGVMVALTTTLNSDYGNKIIVQDAGFLLNNEMDDFSIKENSPNQFNVIGREANSIAPGKRMLSSMSPTLVLKDGKPFLITGSPGGSTIITTALQVIVNVIDHGMSIEDAVSLPRFHHQWQPDRIIYGKYGISPDTLEVLKKMGHIEFKEASRARGIGDANSIMITDSVISGIKDPRNEGAALAY
ncbi:gamma-glutamyltransferase [Candidatus Nitrotoga sp. BS]|uniref:gamma-glutamyltransferase n=1 Tax=Candidatus Nitrotoga sp. BS TaxID=2890408 RepID=UPI001EF33AC2|nr:gamma-glutamyltransferase [Candidatus Nitrotoga sp. BS]